MMSSPRADQDKNHRRMAQCAMLEISKIIKANSKALSKEGAYSR